MSADRPKGNDNVGNRAWYRGENCNFAPTLGQMRALDAVEDHILEGWLPAEPLIGRDTKVTAFGSCFARHIGDYLNRRNYTILTETKANAYVVRMSEGMVHTHAIRGQFDWAFRGIAPAAEVWHGFRGETYGSDERVRLTTRSLLEQTDVFIITLGLSEVWYDEPTGEVFWRAVPEDIFDPSRHRFRVTSVEENAANLLATYRTIREFCPDARVIVTLSPIPLIATFRPVSCITANSVSKAILRTAVDDVYRQVRGEGRFFYWPSYEIVMEAFGSGRWHADRHHVKQPILDYVMQLFEQFYCVETAPNRSLTESRLLAMRAAGDIRRNSLDAARSGAAELEAWIEARIPEDATTAELLRAYARELSAKAENDAGPRARPKSGRTQAVVRTRPRSRPYVAGVGAPNIAGRAASRVGGGLFAPSAMVALAAAAFVPWMHGRPGVRVNGVSDELVAFSVLAAAAALVGYITTRVRALMAVSATAGLVAVAMLAATIDDPLGPFGGPGPNIHLQWGIWLALGGSCGVLIASALVFAGGSLGTRRRREPEAT